MSSLKVELSPDAKADLLNIWDYVYAQNPDAAERLISSILDESERLLTAPLSGKLRAELFPELRSLPHGNYVIYYMPTLYGIRVVRVIHGARDVPPLFRRVRP